VSRRPRGAGRHRSSSPPSSPGSAVLGSRLGDGLLKESIGRWEQVRPTWNASPYFLCIAWAKSSNAASSSDVDIGFVLSRQSDEVVLSEELGDRFSVTARQSYGRSKLARPAGLVHARAERQTSGRVPGVCSGKPSRDCEMARPAGLEKGWSPDSRELRCEPSPTQQGRLLRSSPLTSKRLVAQRADGVVLSVSSHFSSG
jgi:hypothetical protein